MCQEQEGKEMTVKMRAEGGWGWALVFMGRARTEMKQYRYSDEMAIWNVACEC